MHKKIPAFIFGFALLLVLATTAHAAISIRLEQPKSPTNQSSFNINFVTLDTDGNAITVKCQKKGPSDGGFVQFGSDINVNPNGGNTGNCAVDSGVLSANGTYQFQTTANSATSNTVTIDFNNSSGPDTPTNYSKEQLSSCVWRIKFKTANDSGKTVKVEVYRSDQTSFNADSGTRVATISIGSNTDGQADVTSPDCSKTYYFAVRAFDTFGNGSGVVGDSETHVTTTTPTTTTQAAAIPVSATGGVGGSVLGQETQAGQDTQNGEVEGESTAEASTPPKLQASPSTEAQGQTGLLKSRNIIIAIAIVLAAFATYLILKRRSQSA